MLRARIRILGGTMAVCKECGTKVPWSAVLCEVHAKQQVDEHNLKRTQKIKSELPGIHDILVRHGADVSTLPLQDVLDALPRDIDFLAILPNRTFLTNRGILTYDVSFGGRIKKEEMIPLATITGIEAKPPKPGNQYDLWTVLITRANNIDTIFSAGPESMVREFLALTQEGMAAGRSAPAPAAPAQNPAERLGALKQLLEQGLISDAEFEQKKAQIIAEM